MGVLIVGGDRLGKIPARLRSLGFREIEHITGRKKREVLVRLRSSHDLVLVFTDFVNHQTVRAIKEEAKRKQRRVIFGRRAWSEIAPALLTACRVR
ncbi:DUF2325 domain-containing protein [Thermodesulfitimonas sp.]